MIPFVNYLLDLAVTFIFVPLYFGYPIVPAWVAYDAIVLLVARSVFVAVLPFVALCPVDQQ
jgi:hypothetical protein